MIEGAIAYDAYKYLVELVSAKNKIMRAILAKAPEGCSINIEAYILAHQSIHRKLKAGPQGKTEASIYPAHMSMLLDGLSDYQLFTMNYLLYF